jgi:hypothetical protein
MPLSHLKRENSRSNLFYPDVAVNDFGGWTLISIYSPTGQLEMMSLILSTTAIFIYIISLLKVTRNLKLRWYMTLGCEKAATASRNTPPFRSIFCKVQQRTHKQKLRKKYSELTNKPKTNVVNSLANNLWFLFISNQIFEFYITLLLACTSEGQIEWGSEK